MVEIKPMLPDQWQLHKTVRCAALADAPSAYSSTLESVLKRSDEDWRKITHQYASTPNSVTYFVFENEIPCGMSACVIGGNQAEMYAGLGRSYLPAKRCRSSTDRIWACLVAVKGC